VAVTFTLPELGSIPVTCGEFCAKAIGDRKIAAARKIHPRRARFAGKAALPFPEFEIEAIVTMPISLAEMFAIRPPRAMMLVNGFPVDPALDLTAPVRECQSFTQVLVGRAVAERAGLACARGGY
jgi:hypothetical protein